MSQTLSAPPGFVEALEQLLHEAARDGREPFIKLFWLIAPRIKSYAAALGASNEEANNLVIETILTLKREAIRFDPDRMAAGTFLFRLMRNWRIALRRNEFWPMPEPEDPSFAPDPLGELGAPTLRKAASELSTFITSLSETEKRLIKGAFCLDLTHTAIAREMNLPLAHVKQDLRSLVKRLQVFFRELD